jgi:hypothetical protein
MGEYTKCEKCGSDTEYRIEGSTEGLFCTKCDWAIVTTHIPKIAQDITRYKVFLSSADFKNKDHVKTVSIVANKNFVQARKMIQESRPLLFEGEAIEVDKVRDALKSVGVKYEIEPIFPY